MPTKVTKKSKKTQKQTSDKQYRKLNDAVIAKLEQAFAIDATVEQACAYADISGDTYYRWIKEKPELSERFDRLRQQPILAARQTVVTAIQSDPALAFKYLERKQKNEFGQRTEITGADGAPLVDEADNTLKASVDLLKEAVNVAIRQAEQNADVANDAGAGTADS